MLSMGSLLGSQRSARFVESAFSVLLLYREGRPWSFSQYWWATTLPIPILLKNKAGKLVRSHRLSVCGMTVYALGQAFKQNEPNHQLSSVLSLILLHVVGETSPCLRAGHIQVLLDSPD